LAQKRPSALGLERAVVDGLRLGPLRREDQETNFFRARQADANGIEIGDQTSAIIRAAAIQGCFLPPQLFAGAAVRSASVKNSGPG